MSIAEMRASLSAGAASPEYALPSGRGVIFMLPLSAAIKERRPDDGPLDL